MIIRKFVDGTSVESAVVTEEKFGTMTEEEFENHMESHLVAAESADSSLQAITDSLVPADQRDRSVSGPLHQPAAH